jgi:hypothetical protein
MQIFENAKLFVFYRIRPIKHSSTKKSQLVGETEKQKKRQNGVWKHDETSVNRLLSIKMPIYLCQFWCILINVIIVYV